MVLLPRSAPALTERDSILLADFANTTGEPVFDETLKKALAVHLDQSPYLNVVPDERVRETLRYMGRSPDERVASSVAREVCQRDGIKAMLGGSIASLGSHYAIHLEALNCATGTTLAREQAEAGSKEQVLAALGKAATGLREKLGESLGSIQRFDVPLEQATTSSLDALRAFSLGEARRADGVTEALTLSRSATVLLRAARLLSEAGEVGKAQGLVSEAAKRAPNDTFIQSAMLPSVRASIEMNQGRAERAIELMSAVTPNDRAHPFIRRVRGLSYLIARRGPDAVQEIRAILDLRWFDPTSPMFSILHLDLARAHALSGDTAKSRQSYQDFLALMKDADPDLPVLKQARDEYARLR